MPKNSADSILSLYWDDSTIPVNPVQIALTMGLDVSPVDSETLHGASGWYVESDLHISKPTIYVNKNEAPVRQRFTVAHELGHHCLKHGTSQRDTQYPPYAADPKEHAANAFAAELLMPENAVRALIDVRGIRNIADLAKMFAVSGMAMEVRLRTLGYVK